MAAYENVDVIRAAVAAYAERGVDGMTPFWDPEITHRAIEGAPDDVGEMRGPVAVHRYFQDWVDMFDDLTLSVGETRELEDGRVVAEQHVAGRAKVSGAETELRYAVVYTVRDGRIVDSHEYIDLERALAAVGLAP